MRVLVTGAGGFIGGAIARGLVETHKHEVIGMYRTKLPAAKISGLKMQRCDLRGGINLAEQVDFVIHCAALQNFDGIPVKEYIDTNLAITEHVAGYAQSAGVKGLVFASSISLHGEIKSEVVDEHTGIINPTLYGVLKHQCEAVLRDYETSFPTIALRLCGVVGSGSANNWLSRVRESARRGEDIPVFNADRAFNNILHTDDLLGFMTLLMERGFSGFNAFPLASIKPISIREVVEEVVKGLNSRSRIIDKGAGGNPFLISSEYAISKFDYNPSQVRDNLQKFAAPHYEPESR